MKYLSTTMRDFIPILTKENQNNKLEKKSVESSVKNISLEDEIKKLKDTLINKDNEIKRINDEINKIKFENELLKKENKKLNDDLLKLNKFINNIQKQNNNIDNNEIKKLKEEIVLLTNKLNIKDNEINYLKNNIKNNMIEEPKFYKKDIMVINFVSTDSSVHYGIKCLATDNFAEVEEQLYKKFDDLRNTNNMFIVNAKPILRFKKLFENEIKDGDIIQLFKLE